MEDYSKLRAYTLVSTSISIFLYGFSVTLGSLLTQISFYPPCFSMTSPFRVGRRSFI
jgi:hypothetical protein